MPQSSSCNPQKYFSSLTRQTLKAHIQTTIQQGMGVQCNILLIELDGRKAAVKDYAQTPFYFRTFIAPWLLKREVEALLLLKDVPQVPQYYGKVDRLAFVMEYVEGKPISELAEEELDEDLLQQVQNGINAIHNHKIAHGDMKRRTNFLVTNQRKIKIIDFASAVTKRGFTKWLQPAIAEIDNKAVSKIKKLGAPHLMTPQDWDKLNTPTSLERWARKLLGR